MDKRHSNKLIDAMMRADFYPHPVTMVRRRETHISTVLLTGPLVYKIKKPVQLGFLDFSTLEKRQHYCTQEVALNRRLSQGVYHGVVPITYHRGRYRLEGPGPAVEVAVKMNQLEDADAMGQRLTDARLTDSHMHALIQRLVDFYAQAPLADGDDAPVWRENLDQIAPFAGP